ncbi:MAG: peptide chain release factor 1 [Eubacteriales bacterium]|nr:peptide chain release factor 1 [Eubacteriales bacterium]
MSNHEFTTDELFQRYSEHYADLNKQMADPEVAGDPDRYLKLVKEFAQVEPMYLLLKKEHDTAQELEDSQELFSETDDAEMREMAREEINRLEEDLEKIRNDIRVALIPKDPLDEKNVIVEIRAGAGGEEAALFASELYQMYMGYAENKGWKSEVIDANETELGGFKEIVFSIDGNDAYSNLKFESGTHRVQRVPATEAGGRIHTSAVTVAVLPEADEVDVQINPADIQIDTYRSSGAGGQKVNKTSSAIRITHFPTGLVVTCQDERSQHKNKDKALKILRSRLLELSQESQDEAIAQNRKSQVGSGDRSERIRTYNFPQGRVTDHRIGLSLYNMEEVMAGGIQAFITGLQAQAQEKALEEA